MNLYEAILKAREVFGRHIIVEERLINVLSDIGGFSHYPATRYILKSALESGLIKKIFVADLKNLESTKILISQMAMELSQKYGYSQDLSRYVIESVTYPLLKTSLRPSIITPPSDNLSKSQYPNTPSPEVKGNHCGLDKESEIKHLALSGTINSHEWVDLGLPSGLLWATCNVGANKPQEYGDYFAWGEVQTKLSFAEFNSKTYKKTNNAWLFNQGYINSDGNLTAEYDVARQKWGKSWRMPTTEEITELIDNTTAEWKTLDGVKGKLFKSNINGKSIFFPAGGWKTDTYLYNVGRCGGYWSAYASSIDSEYASELNFGSNSYDAHLDNEFRYVGRPVRPVSSPIIEQNINPYLQSNSNSKSESKKANHIHDSAYVNKIFDHEWIDLGLPSGLKWATCNIGAYRPEEHGDYFSWGETRPKSSYAEPNTVTYGMDINRLIEKGYIDEHLHLTMKYDAARQYWGGTWRMPTEEEIQELKENTNAEWITRKWVNGMLFKSKKNGNSIFLPGGGLRDGSSLNDFGAVGCYWSSSPGSGKFYPSYALDFSSFGIDQCWLRRYYGFNIRPVSE